MKTSLNHRIGNEKMMENKVRLSISKPIKLSTLPFSISPPYFGKLWSIYDHGRILGILRYIIIVFTVVLIFTLTSVLTDDLIFTGFLVFSEDLIFTLTVNKKQVHNFIFIPCLILSWCDRNSVMNGWFVRMYACKSKLY